MWTQFIQLLSIRISAGSANLTRNLDAPVNFTCINWATGVSSPCHFQLASILCFQSYYEISPMRRSILLVEVESLPISHNPYHPCIRHGRWLLIDHEVLLSWCICYYMMWERTIGPYHIFFITLFFYTTWQLFIFFFYRVKLGSVARMLPLR